MKEFIWGLQFQRVRVLGDHDRERDNRQTWLHRSS